MSGVLKYAMDTYDLVTNLTDPRTRALPLTHPLEVIGLVVLYVMFVNKWGPQFMKNRPPFKLDRIIMTYNVLQVIGCAHLFFKASSRFFFTYKLFCQPVDRSNTPEAWEVILLTYHYYLLKVADLFDTVFFILRKKNNHVSFLHVYHHAGMVLLIAGALNYVPGGHGSSVGIINSFVHCIMYSYYFWTLYKPEYKNNIWWKKYVTQLQIVQFLITVLHIGSVLFIPNCGYPKFAAILFVPQNIFMLLMFIDFYYKTYYNKHTEIIKNNQKMVNKHDAGDTNSELNLERFIIYQRIEPKREKNL